MRRRARHPGTAAGEPRSAHLDGPVPRLGQRDAGGHEPALQRQGQVAASRRERQGHVRANRPPAPPRSPAAPGLPGRGCSPGKGVSATHPQARRRAPEPWPRGGRIRRAGGRAGADRGGTISGVRLVSSDDAIRSRRTGRWLMPFPGSPFESPRRRPRRTPVTGSRRSGRYRRSDKPRVEPGGHDAEPDREHPTCRRRSSGRR